jgi:hypothetical protein
MQLENTLGNKFPGPIGHYHTLNLTFFINLIGTMESISSDYCRIKERANVMCQVGGRCLREFFFATFNERTEGGRANSSCTDLSTPPRPLTDHQSIIWFVTS